MAGSTRIDELRQKFHENPRRYFAPLANEYRKAGDPEQAIAICRAHLAQQPGHMSGHVVYGQALYDARRIEEARGVFEKALALDPDNAIVLRQLGDIAREKGETDEAKHWYSRALEADPSDKDVAAYIAELTEPVTEVAAEPVAEVAAEPVAEVAAEPAIEAPIELEPVEVPAPITPEIAPQEIEMAVVAPPPVEEEREVEIPSSPEPEVEEIAAPAEEDVAWRTTPPHEESPFVTRTMAELYARQGYREAALDVYRQLALHHPDDKEISDRIEALEQDSSATTPPETQPEAALEAPPEAPAKPKLSELPFEPIISDIASEPEPESVKDFSERAVYGAPPDEDDDFVQPEQAPHFTEMELGGDSWDTDAWGAGFSAGEDIEVEFNSPDVVSEEREAEPEKTETPNLELANIEPEKVEAEAPEPIVPQVAQLDPQPVELEPEPVEPEPIEPEPVAVVPAAEESVEEEEVEAEPAFVAYSPQLPADEELPHFAPKGPTVREFFAALGAFRPSERAGSSITAHAGIAAVAADETETDFPLATDAFSNLFGDSAVSEDDSRAAFALSGALGAAQPAPATPTPPRPAPQVEAPAPATAQESEEDIRRFREWLDGLQES